MQKEKMKFKLSFLVFSLLVVNACVGSDTDFLPQSISEAEKNNLLINKYRPSKGIVKVNSKEYQIKEAFTTTKFNSKKDKTKNNNVYVFIFKLKNIKTGIEFEYEKNLDWSNYINFNSKNGGIHDSNLSISFDKKELSNLKDTIKIGFFDDRKNENIVDFIKQK